MVGMVLFFLGVGVLLCLLAPGATGGQVGSAPGPRAFPADDDVEAEPSSDGIDLLHLGDLSWLDANDPPEGCQDFLLPPLEHPADDWWWREAEGSVLALAAEPDLPHDADLYVNPATGLGIVAGGPAGIDTDGNASVFSSSDDFSNYGTEISLGDTGWNDDSATSFGSDDWS